MIRTLGILLLALFTGNDPASVSRLAHDTSRAVHLAATYGHKSGGGSSSSTVAAPDYETQARTFCSQVLGTGNLGAFFVELGSGHTNGTFGVTGSGTQTTISEVQDTTNSIGGVLRQTTGTTASSSAFWESVNVAGRAPTININNAAVKFCRVFRIRIISTVDANTQIWLGSFTWHAGAIGPISTTKFSAQIGMTLQTSVLSTVNIDANWHTVAHWHDGVHACIQVDPFATSPPETAQCISDTSFWPINGGSTNSFPLMENTKVGGSVDHQSDWAWGLWMVQQ